MTNYLALNTQDIAVMVGLGSFAGASASVCWELIFSASAPNALSVIAAAAGFAAGKILSVRAAQARHAAS